jgi:hypothetical protein
MGRARSTFAVRFFLALSALSLAVMCLPTPGQKNSSLPSKIEATALLEASTRTINLWASDSVPFHLHATVKSYGQKTQIRQGTFELWWASPARFRDEINWGDKSSVRIGDKNLLWIEGSDAHRLDTFRITRLLGFVSRLAIPAGESVDRVRAKKIDGVPVICTRLSNTSNSSGTEPLVGGGLFVLGSSVPERSTCLDATTKLPMRIEDGFHRLELGGYVQVGDKQFPRTLAELSRDGLPIVEMDLDLLEPLNVSETNAFVVSAGAIGKHWCANMVLPRAAQLNFPPGVAYVPGGFITTSPVGINSALLVFRVDETGHPADARAFTIAGEATIRDQEKRALLQSRFIPATCDGKPLEAEFLFRDYPLQSHQ